MVVMPRNKATQPAPQTSDDRSESGRVFSGHPNTRNAATTSAAKTERPTAIAGRTGAAPPCGRAVAAPTKIARTAVA